MKWEFLELLNKTEKNSEIRMFHWTIWLGISFGIAGVIFAFLYTLYQINKERKG